MRTGTSTIIRSSAFRRCAAIVWVLTIAATLNGEEQRDKTFDQFWPEGDVFVKLDDTSRLLFLWAATRTEEGGYTDGQFGGHIDWLLPPFLFKDRVTRHPDIARHRFMTVRAGYLFGKTPRDSANPFVEHTPTIETSNRFFVQKVILTSRNRFDFRFI